jgi:hypothetical protein
LGGSRDRSPNQRLGGERLGKGLGVRTERRGRQAPAERADNMRRFIITSALRRSRRQ